MPAEVADLGPELDEFELDTIRELFNVGVGAAAAALSEMVQAEVLLGIPDVKLFTRSAAIERLGGKRDVVAVRQSFCSAFGPGSAVLMFPETQSLELVRAITGEEGELALTELEQEALTEVGNIILNACLGTLSNMLESEFEIELPRFARGSSAAVLAEEHHEVELVMLLVIAFSVAGRETEGQLAFILDVGSLRAVARQAQSMVA